MSISGNLPADIQNYKFAGTGGKMAAGRQVGSTDYAVAHVEGPDAHDAPATGQPLQVGGVAETTVPAAVQDGDAVRAFFDALGQLGVRIHGTDGAMLLPDRAAMGDGASNQSLSRIAAWLHLYNGSTWDRLRGDTTYGMDVDPTRLVGVAAAIDLALASAATSQTLVSANGVRQGMILNNTDANPVYLYYGTTATLSKFTVKIPAGGYWEMPQPIWRGRIDVVWAADGSGSLIGSEL